MSVSASHTPQAGYMASTTMRQFRSRVAPLDLMLGQQSVADISSAEQVLSAPPAGAAGPLCWAHGLPTHLIELILIHLRDMTGDGRKVRWHPRRIFAFGPPASDVFVRSLPLLPMMPEAPNAIGNVLWGASCSFSSAEALRSLTRPLLLPFIVQTFK